MIQSVSEWVMFSDFGDSYRIYRACELVLYTNAFWELKKIGHKLCECHPNLGCIAFPCAHILLLNSHCSTVLKFYLNESSDFKVSLTNNLKTLIRKDQFPSGFLCEETAVTNL